jgi:hypothetical protein
MLHNPRTIPARNILGAIRAIIDHNDNFLHPTRHAPQAARQIGSLIPGDHRNRYGQFLIHRKPDFKTGSQD